MPLAFKPPTRTLHRKITELFQALYLSVTAYLVYHTQSALSRTFFFFFRRPFGGSQLALNFSDRRPSRSSLFILPDSPRIVKNFFLSFSLFFFSRFAARFVLRSGLRFYSFGVGLPALRACAVCPLHLPFCQARSWFPPSFPIPVFALFCFACYNDPNPSIIYHREE